jgi:hypothetical protein
VAPEAAIASLAERRGTAFDDDAVSALEDCLRPRSRGLSLSFSG